MADEVNHPMHYNSHPSGVEAVVICEHMTFNVGNAIKYCWRAGLKGPADPRGSKQERLKDLSKARWYLDREIERLEKDLSV